MALRILCTADIHLGRGVPAATGDLQTAPRTVSSEAAWSACVDLAIERRVDAFALAGDVVDGGNAFFESFAPLSEGVQRLLGAGIPVYAVAGNHDYEVLARLADHLPAFTLLGRHGDWEEAVLQRDGTAVLRFRGWSFTSPHTLTNPLSSYAPSDDDLPTVNLLHCDCGVASSVYAPVPLAELTGRGGTAWVLGHNHRPQIISEQTPVVFYSGSPQGLDPSETGVHGAWMLSVDHARSARVELLPVAALRWEHVEVALDAIQDRAGLESALVQALLGLHENSKATLGPTRFVGCRLALVGRTHLSRHDITQCTEAVRASLNAVRDQVRYFVTRTENQSRPDISLTQLARAPDPAGLLAQRILVLRDRAPTDTYAALIGRARGPIQEPRARPSFAPLADATELSDDAIRHLLIRAGYGILEDLLAQREAGGRDA